MEYFVQPVKDVTMLTCSEDGDPTDGYAVYVKTSIYTNQRYHIATLDTPDAAEQVCTLLNQHHIQNF